MHIIYVPPNHKNRGSQKYGQKRFPTNVLLHELWITKSKPQHKPYNAQPDSHASQQRRWPMVHPTDWLNGRIVNDAVLTSVTLNERRYTSRSDCCAQPTNQENHRG